MGRLSFLSCSRTTLGLAIFVLCFLPNHAAPVQETGAKPYANEKGCYFMNKHYTSGHEIETNDPCMNCTCTGTAMMCYLRVCPFIKPLGENCKMQEHRDDCCPKYWCPKVYPRVSTPRPESEEKGCYVDGSYYDEGARLPIDPFNPCHACYCIRNVSVCTKETCELNIPGCYPRYKIGSCCPERYTCTEEAATTIPPTSTEEEVLPGCDVDGVFYNDGEVVPSNETCKKCYCMRHQVMCTAIECTAPGTNCVPHDVIEGQCCPERYDCPEGTEIPEFATTHMLTTEEEYLNISTTVSPATLTTASISVSAADEQLTSAVASESPSTLESETAYPTTKGVRRIEDEDLTTVAALEAEASTAESPSVPTDMSARPRVPKITEVPDEMFTTASSGRQRPTFRPIPGEGICRFEGKTYQTGEKVIPEDPCLVNCTCIHSVVKCDRLECVLNPPQSRKSCKIKKLPDECCPKYVCDIPSLPAPNKTETPEQQIIVDVFSSTVGIEQETISASLGTTEDVAIHQRITVTHIPVQQTEMDVIATTFASKITDREITSESLETSSEVILGQTTKETTTVHTEEPDEEISTVLTSEEEKLAKETMADKDLTITTEELPKDKFSTTKISEVSTESSFPTVHEEAGTIQTTDKTTIKTVSETETITTPSTSEEKMIDVSKVTSTQDETTAVTLSSTDDKDLLLTIKTEDLAETKITSTLFPETTSDIKLSTQKETIVVSTTAKSEVEGTTIAQTEASEGTQSIAEETGSSTVTRLSTIAKDMLEQTTITSEETKQTIKEIKTTSSPLTTTKAEKITITSMTQKEEEFTSLEAEEITSGTKTSSETTRASEEVITELTKITLAETSQSELDTKAGIEAEMITQTSWITKEEDKGVEVTRVDESTTDKIKSSVEDITTRHSITEEAEFTTAETTTDAESIISTTLKSATETDKTLSPKQDQKITAETEEPTKLDITTISESETESVTQEAVTPKISTSTSESEQQVTTMKQDMEIITLKSETKSDADKAEIPKTTVSIIEKMVTTEKSEFDFTSVKMKEFTSAESPSVTDVKETSESESSEKATPATPVLTASTSDVERSTEEGKFTIQPTTEYVVTTPESEVIITEIVRFTKEDEVITTKESEQVTSLPVSSTVSDRQPSEQDVGVSTSEPKMIFTEEREPSAVENGTVSAILTTLKSSLPEFSTVTSTAVPKLSTEDMIEITEISKLEETTDVHMTSSESVTFFSEITPKTIEETSDSGVTKKISTKQEDKLTTLSLAEDFTSSIKEISDEEQMIKTTAGEHEITSKIASSEGDTAVTEHKTSISTKEAIDESTALTATKATVLTTDLTSSVAVKEKVTTVTIDFENVTSPEMASSEESTLPTTEVFKLKPSEDESSIITELTSSTLKSDAEKATSTPKWSEPEFSTVQTEKSEELFTASSTEKSRTSTKPETISSELSSEMGLASTVMPGLDKKQRVTISEKLDFTTQEAEIVTDQTTKSKTHLPDSLIRDITTHITETSTQTPGTSKFSTSEFSVTDKFESTTIKPHLKEVTEITEDLRTDFVSSEITDEVGIFTSTKSGSEAVEMVSIKSTDKIGTETSAIEEESDFTSKITISRETYDSYVTAGSKTSTVPTEEKTLSQIDLDSTVYEKPFTTTLKEVSSIVTLKSETTTVEEAEETTTTMKPERKTASAISEKTTESISDTEGVFPSKTSEATTLKISTQEEELQTSTLKPERESTVPLAERTRQDVSKEEPLSLMTTSEITISDATTLIKKDIQTSTMKPDWTQETVSTVDEIPRITSETTILRESTIEEAESLTSTFKPEEETTLPEKTRGAATEGDFISKATSEHTTEKITTVEEAKLISSTLKPKITSESTADTKVTAETSTIRISTIEETESQTSTVKSEKTQETVSELDVTFGTMEEKKESISSTLKLESTVADTFVTSRTTFADSTLQESELQTTTLKPEKTRETASEMELTSGEAVETITLSISSEEEAEALSSTLKPEKTTTSMVAEGTSKTVNLTSKEIFDITTLSISTIEEELRTSTLKPEKETPSIFLERTTEVVTETGVVSRETSESTVESAVSEKDTEQLTSTLKSEVTPESVTETVTSTSRLSLIEKETHITDVEPEGSQKTLSELDVTSRHTTVTSPSTSRITETRETESLTSTLTPEKETIDISTERTSVTTSDEGDDISKETSKSMTAKMSTIEETEPKLSTVVPEKETISTFADGSKEVPAAGDAISKVTLETTTGKSTRVEEIDSLVTTLEAQRTSEFVSDITSEIITSEFSTVETKIATSTLKPEREIIGIFTEITQEPTSEAVTSIETETLKVTGIQEELLSTILTTEKDTPLIFSEKEVTSGTEELTSKLTSETSESEEEAEPITSTLKSIKEIISTSTDRSRETATEVDVVSKATSETTTETTTVAEEESSSSTLKSELTSEHVSEIDISSEITTSKLSTIEEAEKLTSTLGPDRETTSMLTESDKESKLTSTLGPDRETTSMLTESDKESISEIDITSRKVTDITSPKVSPTEETKLITSTLIPETETTGILTEEAVEPVSEQKASTSTTVFTITGEKETPSAFSETSTSRTTSARTTTVTEEEALTSTLKPDREMTSILEKTQKTTTEVDVTGKTFSETTELRTTKKDLELITSTLKPEKESTSTEIIEKAVSEEKEITSKAAETTMPVAITIEEAGPLASTLQTEDKSSVTFTEQSVTDIKATTSEVTLNMTTSRFSTLDEGKPLTSTLKAEIKNTSIADRTTELVPDDMDTSLGVTSKTTASIITSTDTAGLVTETLMSEEETEGILTLKPLTIEDVISRTPFETTTSKISTLSEAKSLTSTLIPERKTEIMLTDVDSSSSVFTEATTSKATVTEEELQITTLTPEKETSRILTAATKEIEELSSETTTIRPSTVEEAEIVATTLKEEQKSTSELTEKAEELTSKTKDLTESTSRTSIIEELESLTTTEKQLRDTTGLISEISSETVSQVYETTFRLPAETTKARISTVAEVELPSTMKSEIQTATTLSDKTTESISKVTTETSEEKFTLIEEAEPQTSTMKPEIEKTSLATEKAKESVPESDETTQTISLETTSHAFSAEEETKFLITTRESTRIAEETSEPVSRVEDISSGIEVSELTTEEEKLYTSTLVPDRNATSIFTEETRETGLKEEDEISKVTSETTVSKITAFRDFEHLTSTLIPEGPPEPTSEVEEIAISKFTTIKEELQTSTLKSETETTLIEETREVEAELEDVTSKTTSEIRLSTTKSVATEKAELMTSTITPVKEITSILTDEAKETVSENLSTSYSPTELVSEKHEKVSSTKVADQTKSTITLETSPVTTSTFKEAIRTTEFSETSVTTTSPDVKLSPTKISPPEIITTATEESLRESTPSSKSEMSFSTETFTFRTEKEAMKTTTEIDKLTTPEMVFAETETLLEDKTLRNITTETETPSIIFTKETPISQETTTKLSVEIAKDIISESIENVTKEVDEEVEKSKTTVKVVSDETSKSVETITEATTFVESTVLAVSSTSISEGHKETLKTTLAPEKITLTSEMEESTGTSKFTEVTMDVEETTEKFEKTTDIFSVEHISTDTSLFTEASVKDDVAFTAKLGGLIPTTLKMLVDNETQATKSDTPVSITIDLTEIALAPKKPTTVETVYFTVETPSTISPGLKTTEQERIDVDTSEPTKVPSPTMRDFQSTEQKEKLFTTKRIEISEETETQKPFESQTPQIFTSSEKPSTSTLVSVKTVSPGDILTPESKVPTFESETTLSEHTVITEETVSSNVTFAVDSLIRPHVTVTEISEKSTETITTNITSLDDSTSKITTTVIPSTKYPLENASDAEFIKDITAEAVTITITPEIFSAATTSKTGIEALTTVQHKINETKMPFEEDAATATPETLPETPKFFTQVSTETIDKSRAPVTTPKESKTTEGISTAEINTLLETSEVTKFPSFKITTTEEEERSEASISEKKDDVTLSIDADVVATDISLKEDSEKKDEATDITTKVTQKEEFTEVESTKERTVFASTTGIYPKTTYQEAEEAVTIFTPEEKLNTSVATSTEVYTEQKITVSGETESKETLQTVTETKLSTLEDKITTVTSLLDSSEDFLDLRDEKKDTTEKTDFPASLTEKVVTSTISVKEMELSTVRETFENDSSTAKSSTAFISTSELDTEVTDSHTTLRGVTLKLQTTITPEETPQTTESITQTGVTESVTFEAEATKAHEITAAFPEEKQTFLTTKISEITTDSSDFVHKLTDEIATKEVTIPSSTLSKEFTEELIKSTDLEQSTFSDVPLAVTKLAETMSDTTEKEQTVETKPVILATTEIHKLETSEPSKSTEKTADVTESTASTATTIPTDISIATMTTAVYASTTVSKQVDLTTMPEAVPTEKIPEEDLPEEGDCIVDGVSYKDGESIKTVQPCEKCHCSLGEITCFKIICKSPKEGCIPSANMTSECCPSSYDCPEDDEVKTSMASTSIHDITEKDLTTPIPISFMFSTMPTSIASTVIVTKLDKALEPTTKSTERKSSVDIQTPEEQITSEVTTSAISTKEKTEELMSTVTPITISTEWKITAEVSKETKPVSLEAETTEITPKHVTLITQEHELFSTTQVPVTLTKDIFKTEASATTLTPEKEITITKELMTGIEEKITEVTKQPTETPTTFDTTKTTFVMSHEEKDVSERTTLTSSELHDISKLATTVSHTTFASEPEDATMKSTSVVTDRESVTMEKTTTSQKAIDTVPTTVRIDETRTAEPKVTFSQITTEKPLDEKEFQSTTLQDFVVANVTDELRTETPTVKEEITLSTSTLIPSKFHSSTESESRKTIIDNITSESETVETLSTETTVAAFGMKGTESIVTDVDSTSSAEIEKETQTTTTGTYIAETHTATLSAEEISTSEGERKVTDFSAATESKETEFIDPKKTTLTISTDEAVTDDDIKKMTDFTKTTESRITDSVEARRTITTLSMEELLISEGQKETTDLPRTSVSKMTETGITTDTLSVKETSTATGKINITEDLSRTTATLHDITTERTTLDMITDLQDKSTVPAIKVSATTISETRDQATPSKVTSSDHTTPDSILSEKIGTFHEDADTFATSTVKSILTTSSTEIADYEIITEVAEMNRSITSLDREVSVTTHINETEFPTVGIINETTTLEEKSEEAETAPSVTDKIFTFVSTRFTDIMKEITEFTTGKPETESVPTFEKETILVSTPDLTTEQDEQITPLVHLTRRIDLDLDKTTVKDSTSQEAETTRSQFTDELSTLEPHTDFADKVQEKMSANDTGFSTSRRDMTPEDIFTTISSIITSMKQETVSPVSESEKPIIISTEPVKVTDSETSTYLTKEDSVKSTSDYTTTTTKTTTLESKPTLATDDIKTSLGVDVTTRTVSPVSYSEKDILFTETIPKEADSGTMYETKEESSKPTSDYASTEDVATLETRSTLATDDLKTTFGAAVTTSSQMNKTDSPYKVSEEISVTPSSLTTLVASTLETKEISLTPESRLDSTTAEDTLVSEFKKETTTEVSLSESKTLVFESETAKSDATATKISEVTLEVKTESITPAPEQKRDTTVSEMEMLSRGTRKDMELEVTLLPFTTDLTRERADEDKITTSEVQFSFETTSPKPITSTTLLHKLSTSTDESTTIRDLKLSSLSTHTEKAAEETGLIDNETMPTVSEKERTENVTTTPSVTTDLTRDTALDISSTQKVPKEMDVDIVTQFALNETTTASTLSDITDLTKLPTSEVTSKVQDTETTAVSEVIKTTKIGTVTSSPEESTLPSKMTSVIDRTATTATPIKTDKPKPEQEAITIDLEAETVTSSPRDQTSSSSEKADRTSPEVTTQTSKEENVTEMLTKGYKGIETTTMQDEEDYLIDENTCIFEGRIYQSAEQIPRADPCEFCFCFRGDIICLQQSCPPPAPNCNQTMIPGYCCPRYECPVYLTSKNIPSLSRRKGVSPIIIQKRIDKREIKTVEIQGCQINGTFYELGKTVTSASGPCLHCVCQADGLMHCDPQRCKPEAPLMLKMNNNYFRRR